MVDWAVEGDEGERGERDEEAEGAAKWMGREKICTAPSGCA